MPKVTIAQLTPKSGDKAYNVTQVSKAMESANKENSQVVVFPELFLTGYSIDGEIESLAETREGKYIRQIQGLCKKYDMHTVIGFAEKGKTDYYISSALIDNQGRILDVYQKTHLFDDEKKTFTPGDQLKVVDTIFGKVGLMICFDIEFPEVARTLKLMGAEILLVTNANMTPYEDDHYTYAKSRAMENEIPLVICNRLGTEGQLNFCGDSMAITHRGNQLLYLQNKEQVATVELSIPKETDIDGTSLNYLQNRRPDLYL